LTNRPKMSSLQRKKGRKSNYVKKNLNTDYWRLVRQKVIFRDRSCRICGSKLFLEVHHLTYFANGKSIVGNELQHLDKLVLLCAKCHKEVHNNKNHKFNPKNYKNVRS